MKGHVFCAVIAVAFVTGCTSARRALGATAENDQNVLTGGPATGTTINDLPQPVKDTLALRVTTAEIADIEKQDRSGIAVYRIMFFESGKYPAMFIDEDGIVVQPVPKQGRGR